MSQYGFYFDMSRCVGCRACQLACKGKNGLTLEATLRRVRTFETGTYPNPGIYHLAETCNHCENALCVDICPTSALVKLDNGIVDHNPELCIGCRVCIPACPYDAPQYVEEQDTIKKCDFCRDLVENRGSPACVDACMMRALHFGEMSDLAATYGADAVKDLPVLPPSSTANPSLLIKPRRHAFSTSFVEKQV